jgi:hypothetical protein
LKVESEKSGGRPMNIEKFEDVIAWQKGKSLTLLVYKQWSMLYVAVDLGYITKQELEKMYNLSYKISRILGGFIKTL